jgi:hypothetical protein
MNTLTRPQAARTSTDVDPEVLAEGFKAWRDAAQEQIAEPVIEACILSRPSSQVGSRVAGYFGWLPALMLHLDRRRRAAGLPQHFVLAVTAGEVIALERTTRPLGSPVGTVGREVARWQRSTLRVSSRPSGNLIQVTLTPAAPADPVQCTLNAHALSDRFIALLSDPSRQTRTIAG